MQNILTLIDPPLATYYLSKNTDVNRSRFNPHTRDRYARDMARGAWVLNHQGIAFDTEGHLSDGQHRLAGIELANVSVQMYVATGLPVNAVLSVDEHYKRRTTFQMMLAGGDELLPMKNHRATLVGALQHMARIDRGIAYSRAELVALAELHQDALQFLARALPGKHVRGVTVSPVLAALGRAFYHETEEDLLHIAEVLVSGMATSPRDQPLIALRNNMVGSRVPARSLGGPLCRKVQRVIAAYVNREPLTHIYETERDYYPLPASKRERELVTA